MKSTYFQNYLTVLFVLAVFCSALLAHTGLALVGILGGFVLSMVAARFLCKKWWNGELASQITPWKKWGIATLVAAVGSQMGWAALLI